MALKKNAAITGLAVLGVSVVITLSLFLGRGSSHPTVSRSETRLEDDSGYEPPDGDTPAQSIDGFAGEVQLLKDQLQAQAELDEEQLAALAEGEAEKARLVEELRAQREAFETRVAELVSEQSAQGEQIGEQVGRLVDSLGAKIKELESEVSTLSLGRTVPVVQEAPEPDHNYPSGSTIPATALNDIVWVASLDESGSYVPPESSGAEGEGSGGFGGLLTAGLLGGGAEGGGGGLFDVDATAGGEVLGGDGGGERGARPSPNVRSEMVWVEPVDVVPADDEPSGPIPRFTLPDLSVLGGASALTSLVGRIYEDEESIINPYPIRVLIGRDNLTASFKELPPEIEAMIFGGFAVGDWTLSCVKGVLTAATFVFEDGTIRSAYVGDPGTRPGGGVYANNSIGYVTDEFGNPCIWGDRVSDAPEFLATRAALAGIEGYANALRQQEIQSTTFTDADGTAVVESIVGEASDYARASAYVEGIRETADWVRELQAQSFNAVYAPSGRTLSVLLEQELRLDYDPDGRKIVYETETRRYDRLD